MNLQATFNGLQPRQILCRSQILKAVEVFSRKNLKSEIVVVYSGAGARNWLAVPTLQEKGYTYIAASPHSLDTKLVAKLPGAPTSGKELQEFRIKILKSLLEEDEKVIRFMGYRNYQDFFQKQSQKSPAGPHVYIALEETTLYSENVLESWEPGRVNSIFESISVYIKTRKAAGKSVAVLYLTESPDVSGFRRDFDKKLFRPKIDPRDILFQDLSQSGVSVGFAGVSYPESRTDGTF